MSGTLRLDALVEAYRMARLAQAVARRACWAIQCNERRIGDEPIPPCYASDSPAEGWCESCRTREPLYQQWRQAQLTEREARARLHAAWERDAVKQQHERETRGEPLPFEEPTLAEA